MTLSELTSSVSALTEGTWSLPDTFDKVKEVMALLNAPINWSDIAVQERIYAVIGDDDLFDELDRAVRWDKAPDVRYVLLKHLPRLIDTQTWSQQPDEQTKFALGLLRRKVEALRAGGSTRQTTPGSPHTP